MKRTIVKVLLLSAMLALGSLAFGQTVVQQSATDLAATNQVAYSRTSAATITLAAVGGQFHYITGIEVSNCAGSSAVTAAVPIFITTTNIAGSPQFMAGSGVAAGLCQPALVYTFPKPIKAAVVGTATTFVLPTFATNQTLSVNVYYYVAP